MRRKSLLLSLAAIFCAISSATSALAAEIAPGWDLFETAPGTTFNGAAFTGVPIGTYNFGGTIGTKPIGNTDTIVRRLGSAVVAVPPGNAVVPVEMVALQLVSALPVDLGAGLNLYYITLQSARGGPQTTGNLNIQFADNNGGTFSSFFDVFFDLRVGALDGPIIFSGDLPLTQNGDSWTRVPPPGTITIPGVNTLLNGTNTEKDFWPGVPFTESHPNGTLHVVTNPTVPLPAAVWSATLLLGLLGVARRVRRNGNS